MNDFTSRKSGPAGRGRRRNERSVPVAEVESALSGRLKLDRESDHDGRPIKRGLRRERRARPCLLRRVGAPREGGGEPGGRLIPHYSHSIPSDWRAAEEIRPGSGESETPGRVIRAGPKAPETPRGKHPGSILKLRAASTRPGPELFHNRTALKDGGPLLIPGRLAWRDSYYWTRACLLSAGADLIKPRGRVAFESGAWKRRQIERERGGGGSGTHAVSVELMLVLEREWREMSASPRFTTPLLVMEKLRSR